MALVVLAVNEATPILVLPPPRRVGIECLVTAGGVCGPASIGIERLVTAGCVIDAGYIVPKSCHAVRGIVGTACIASKRTGTGGRILVAGWRIDLGCRCWTCKLREPPRRRGKPTVSNAKLLRTVECAHGVLIRFLIRFTT